MAKSNPAILAGGGIEMAMKKRHAMKRRRRLTEEMAGGNNQLWHAENRKQ
jgi:hypothetical protein